jgi:hypothetical protein
MKTILLLLTLTIGNSYSAPIPISALPASITSPGSYRLTGDLSCSASVPAITINSPKAGEIVLDLNGFTISAVAGVSNPPGVYILNPTNSKILVKNGGVASFFTGVYVNDSSVATKWVTNIQIENVNFGNDGYASVNFYQANGCSVTSCSFSGQADFGIKDAASETGNKFLDNTFDGTQFTILAIQGGLVASKIIDCLASPVPSPKP